MFGAASEAFSQKNINCSIAESIERFAPVATGRTRCRHARSRRDLVRARLSVPGRGDARGGRARRAADAATSAFITSASPTRSASGRPRRRSARWRRRSPSYPGRRGERPFPRHVWPGARERLREPRARHRDVRHERRGSRRMPVCERRDRQRRDARTSSTCCTAWRSRPAIDLDRLRDAGRYICDASRPAERSRASRARSRRRIPLSALPSRRALPRARPTRDERRQAPSSVASPCTSVCTIDRRERAACASAASDAGRDRELDARSPTTRSARVCARCRRARCSPRSTDDGRRGLVLRLHLAVRVPAERAARVARAAHPHPLSAGAVRRTPRGARTEGPRRDRRQARVHLSLRRLAGAQARHPGQVPARAPVQSAAAAAPCDRLRLRARRRASHLPLRLARRAAARSADRVGGARAGPAACPTRRRASPTRR